MVQNQHGQHFKLSLFLTEKHLDLITDMCPKAARKVYSNIKMLYCTLLIR